MQNLLLINNLSIFSFSDSHGNHQKLQVPEDAYIVICAGDAVEDNLKGGEYNDFIDWFAELPAKWKLFVPGNHELSFELDLSETIEKAMEAKGILVLQNSVIDCDGVVIGSVSGNAFIADEDIPSDIDVLVTHYPPFGILDEDLGSPEILNFVMKSKPAYHLFGHVHATEGQEFILDKTLCKNICVFNQIIWPQQHANASSRYTILDDENVFFQDQQDHLVQTNEFDGLTAQKAMVAIDVLYH